MMTQIRASFQRSRATMLQDAVGVVALAVMLVIALHLPGLV